MNFKRLLKAKFLIYILQKNISKSNRFIPFEVEPGVYPYLRRQIPLDGLKSLDERLKEIEKAKHELELESVNIGYKIPENPNNLIKQNKYDQQKSVDKKEIINVNEFYNISKFTSSTILRKFNIAQFYNIFTDLYVSPHFFYPIKPMEIEFNYDEDCTIPVYDGNLISPSVANIEPFVSFESCNDSLWTLIMSCPDEHLIYNDKEYVHWIISNMKMDNGMLKQMDRIVPYLQPIPYLGSGFHRYIFVLYKQDKGHVDLNAYSLSENCQLEDRTFSSHEFMKANQELLTPVGLSFFQATWDFSVRECFRENLNCREPIFDYKWPKNKLKPMKEFPENEVMHKYWDQYRDVKDIREEVLKEQLKNIDPFKSEKRLEFPLGIPDDPDEIGFVKEKFKDKELRLNQWKEMEVNDDQL